MREIAPRLAIVSTLIANAYLVGDRLRWVLVDACIPGKEGLIQRAAERRFGRGSRPAAILLTHGHFDHAGSAGALADLWKVPIYAHERELPYVTGRAHYPPFNYNSPGFFTRIARFCPTKTVDLGTRAGILDPKQPVPGLPGWQAIETPGHTPGHLAFFHSGDGVLLAGDAVTTMNLDSFFATMTRRQEVCRPPVPATANWKDAHRSVELLASLRPSVICAGHGAPVHDAADGLSRLAAHFPFPEYAQSNH